MASSLGSIDERAIANEMRSGAFLHQIELNGWRIQLHVVNTALYIANSHDRRMANARVLAWRVPPHRRSRVDICETLLPHCRTRGRARVVVAFVSDDGESILTYAEMPH
jgi:hypothetical protein